MATWQENLASTAKDPKKIASEIARASSIIASGKGTTETTRYLNQVNALKDGASLSNVISGSYDNYSGSKDPSGTYGSNGNWNAVKVAERVPVVAPNVVPVNLPTPFDINTSNMVDPSSYHVDYVTGVVKGGGGQSFETVNDVVSDGIKNAYENISNAVDGITPDWMKFVSENGVAIVGGLVAMVFTLKLFGK